MKSGFSLSHYAPATKLEAPALPRHQVEKTLLTAWPMCQAASVRATFSAAASPDS